MSIQPSDVKSVDDLIALSKLAAAVDKPAAVVVVRDYCERGGLKKAIPEYWQPIAERFRAIIGTGADKSAPAASVGAHAPTDIADLKPGAFSETAPNVAPVGPAEEWTAAPAAAPVAPDVPVQGHPTDADLIANGYFPVVVRGKVPVVEGWQNGEVTPERIAAERAAHPDAMSTGLRTGELVGLDIDVIDAAHAEQVKQLAFDVLGRTSLERVGMKGMILCYRNAEPMHKITIAGAVKDKVEVLGLGQQFVAYGVHPDTGKPYRWLDDEPLNMCLGHLELVTPDMLRDFARQACALLSTLRYAGMHVTGETEHEGRAATPRTELDAKANVSRALDYIKGDLERHGEPKELEGSDNRTYVVAAQLRSFGLSDEKIVDVLHEHWAPRFDREWIADKVANADKYGQNERGADAIILPDPAVIARLAADSKPADDTKPSGNFLMTVADVLAMPDPTELVTGFMMEHENAALVGAPKIGKTFIALDIALSIAADLPVFGQLPVKRSGPVVYLSGEGHAGMKRRVKAWCQERGIADPAAFPFYYKTEVPMTREGVDAAIKYIDGIRGALASRLPVLVVIDTMARSMAGKNENASGDMGEYLDLTERLRIGLDCTCLTLAHAPKDTSKGIDIRGSGASTAGFDAVWTLEENEENGILKLDAPWLKDAVDLGPFYVQLKTVYVTGMKLNKGAVVEHMSRNEYHEHAADTEKDAERRQIYNALAERQIYEPKTGLSLDQMVDIFAGPEPGEEKEQAEAWRVNCAKERKRLHNGMRRGGRKKNGPARYAGLFYETVFPGGTEIQRLFRLPRIDGATIH